MVGSRRLQVVPHILQQEVAPNRAPKAARQPPERNLCPKR